MINEPSWQTLAQQQLAPAATPSARITMQVSEPPALLLALSVLGVLGWVRRRGKRDK